MARRPGRPPGAREPAENWGALRAAVGAAPRRHPLEPSRIGEFAVRLHRSGPVEAVRVFPEVAEHLGLGGRLVPWEMGWMRDRAALLDSVRRACAECAEELAAALTFADGEWGPTTGWFGGPPGEATHQPWSGVAAGHALPSMPLAAIAPPGESGELVRLPSEGGPVRTRGLRRYEIGASSITLRLGDIRDSRADALVSSDDAWLSMGGGVSAALLEAAGRGLRAEARKLARTERPRVGDVVVTAAGRLPARYVLHAITIGPEAEDVEALAAGAAVRQAVQRVVQLATALGCRSVALPAIGAGAAGFDFAVVAAEMGQALVGALRESGARLDVELVLLDRYGAAPPAALFDLFGSAVERTLGLAAVVDAGAGSDTVRLLTPAQAAAASAGPRDGDEVRRRQEIVRTLRDLDRRRDELEGALVRTVVGKEPAGGVDVVRLRQQLAELRATRDGYEEELTGVPTAPPSGHPSVFLSSTFVDLQPYRQRLRAVIERLGFLFVGMEAFPPSPEPPAVLIKRLVDESGLYLGVLGMRYGAVDESTGYSMTELEYRQAVASGKPVHVFALDPKAPITVDMVETDPQRYARLVDFRRHVMEAHTVGWFTDADDLERKAQAALASLRP